MNVANFSGPTAAPFVDPAVLAADPHGVLVKMRRHYPVIRISDLQYYILRAADALPLMTDPRVIQIEGRVYADLQRIPQGKVRRFMEDQLLLSNGAEHRRRRGLFARAFAYRSIDDARPAIRAVADRIVADLPRGESLDFVGAVAARLPAEVIASLLGLPVGDASWFGQRVYLFTRSMAPIYPIADHPRIETAATELFHYIDAALRQRLEQPEDDLLSRLALEWQEAPVMPFIDLINQVLALIIAGTDTTRASFASMITCLLQDRDQWNALRADRSLVPGAVAEGLRFEPAVASFPRFATCELRVGGTRVPAGALLLMHSLSFLRDPALYDRPDVFDIRRPDHPRVHPVFGHGPHRCIGELLARLEMAEGLEALLDAAPDLVLEEPISFRGFGGLRELGPMQVRLPESSAN